MFKYTVNWKISLRCVKISSHSEHILHLKFISIKWERHCAQMNIEAYWIFSSRQSRVNGLSLELNSVECEKCTKKAISPQYLYVLWTHYPFSFFYRYLSQLERVVNVVIILNFNTTTPLWVCNWLKSIEVQWGILLGLFKH